MNTDNESLPMTDAGSEFQTDGAAHRKERFAKSVRANGRMSSGVATSAVFVRWRGGWCVGWGTAVPTCSESCMSTQTPCSQFCVEPAASVVDASAVWHETASVPEGRFWLHCSAHAATSGCCWLERRRVPSYYSPVSSGSDCRPVSVPDRSTIDGVHGRWLVYGNCTTGSPP